MRTRGDSISSEIAIESLGPLLPDWVPPEVDRTKAHPARIYDYLLGGKDNFDVDRDAAEVALAAMPELRGMARANRAFLGRAIRHLTAAGISQFLDLGTGIPSSGNTVEVARSVRPEARVVCIDYDPYVSAHSRALLTGSDPSATAVVQADVRQPESILENSVVRSVLDFDRPIAVIMAALLHFVTDDENAAGVVARFVDAVAPGSALVVSHGSEGHEAGKFGAARKGWKNATSQISLRDKAGVEAFFIGTELVDPGVVIIPAWRPDFELGPEEMALDYGHAGVGIKP